MLGMADMGPWFGPGFFLGGLVVRRPLERARDVSSRRFATSAYLHSVCLLMQAKQFGRPRSHCLHVSYVLCSLTCDTTPWPREHDMQQLSTSCAPGRNISQRAILYRYIARRSIGHNNQEATGTSFIRRRKRRSAMYSNTQHSTGNCGERREAYLGLPLNTFLARKRGFVSSLPFLLALIFAILALDPIGAALGVDSRATISGGAWWFGVVLGTLPQPRLPLDDRAA